MRKMHWVVLLSLVLAALPVVAQDGLTLPEGDDGWVTQGGGQTSIDLSRYPLQQVFGGSASNPIVNLKGAPINQASFGSADTFVRRLEPLTLSGVGSSGTVKTQLVALRMVSESPVVIGGKSYSLKVCNSRRGSSEGTATFTLSNDDGGTFDSTFDVTPRLVFTRVGNPSSVVVIDCAAYSCGENLQARNAAWVRTGGSGNFDPATAGATIIEDGIGFDGDCDGVNEGTTSNPGNGGGGSQVFPGFSPETFKPVSSGHDHEQQLRFHQVVPATDCLVNTTAAAASQGGREAVIVEPAPKPVYCAKLTPIGTVN